MGRILSFHAVLIAGLVVIGALTVAGRFNDPDLWFHLRLGQLIWDTHSIPTTETLSFTAQGHSWIAHEWLAQLGIYATYRAAGYTGLMVWLTGWTSVLLVVAYVLCFRCSGSSLTSFLTATCVWFFATTGLAIRPLLMGNTFLALELLLLDLGRKNKRWFWLLPPLFAVWVNCHGSYWFGFGVLGVHCLAGLKRRGDSPSLFIVVVCGLALFCNPIGPRLLWYPFDTLLNQRTNLGAVQEWLPPALNTGRGLAMVAAIVLVAMAGMVRRAHLRLPELLTLAMAAFLATQHFRMLFVFGIALAPVMARLLSNYLGEDRSRQHPVANAILVGLCAVAVGWAFPSREGLAEQVRAANPTGAVDYIRKSGLTGPMLNEYVFGGYLLWAMPEHPVFIDGRCDVFDWTGVLREYGQWATLEEDPQLLLEKYHIRFCLLRRDAPISRVLTYLPGWKVAYSDDSAMVFVR